LTLLSKSDGLNFQEILQACGQRSKDKKEDSRKLHVFFRSADERMSKVKEITPINLPVFDAPNDAVRMLCKLQNWHPTSWGDVDSTNNHDIAALNAADPNPPMLAFQVTCGVFRHPR
jgi:hypothetical protein